MKHYDVVVIGGSAAGVTAAITARRHYPDRTILVIRREEKVPIPCGIPYVFGTIRSTQKNLIPDHALTDNGIDLVVDEATSIDRAGHVVRTKSGEEVSYGRLVLATGSVPLAPPIPGIEKDGVFFARKDVAYLDAMLSRIEAMKEVVILGGGFIGVEFADELRKLGLKVTIVEMLPHCLMLAFEEDLCMEAEERLQEVGVEVATNAKVEEIVGEAGVSGVCLSGGRTIRADAVIVGIGVRPNTELAKNAGLEVAEGGIVVDRNMRTSDNDIFACGDCASKVSYFTGKVSNLRLASVAAMEARIAGANLFEVRRENRGVIGVFSTALAGIGMGVAGLSEAMARENGFEVVSGTAEAPNRHPGGMPGMATMKVKLVFNRSTGELLGGMARGGESVGELVNTISACIQGRMTANDIAQFQLGTHPALTASPIAYQLVNAAEIAQRGMKPA